ncbi:hypothetical protein JTB14_033959 [Gonioctena quinquepunctata]|nr:hypothetical protein JTB14_033959 [Gonioctena quinquepunctata]
MWNQSIVISIPEVKKPKAPEDLRPISFLPFLSIILEKAIAHQLRDQHYNNNILPTTQSGFRSNYGCAPALLNIIDDIVRASDSNKDTALISIDNSNTINYIP